MPLDDIFRTDDIGLVILVIITPDTHTGSTMKNNIHSLECRHNIGCICKLPQIVSMPIACNCGWCLRLKFQTLCPWTIRRPPDFSPKSSRPGNDNIHIFPRATSWASFNRSILILCLTSTGKWSQPCTPGTWWQSGSWRRSGSATPSIMPATWGFPHPWRGTWPLPSEPPLWPSRKWSAGSAFSPIRARG